MTKRSIFVSTLSIFLFGSLLILTACGGGAIATNGGGGDGGGISGPSIATASLPAGTVGAAYSTTLQATGGKTPYVWSVKSGSLPTGLSMNNSGAITGTPQSPVTAGLVFTVTDANKKSATSKNFSLKVNPEAGPVVETASLPGGSVGFAYSATLQASGGKGPYTWSIKSGVLPAGLSFSTTGAITGTPTASGDFASIVFAVTDFYKSVGDSSGLSIHVDPLKVPTVLTSSLPSGKVGSSYSFSLQATGGSGNYTWSVRTGTLPGGLALDAATGTISGSPTTPMIVSPIVFQVHDADTATADSSNLLLQIYDAQGCSAGTEANLGSQPYAFLLKGFDSNGPVLTLGNFTPNGVGGITGGSEDVNNNAGLQSALTINPSGSSYTLGADNVGCLTLLNSNGTATTFRYALADPNNSGLFNKGLIIEFDDNNGSGTSASGILRLQDSSAFSTGLNGMYAFLFFGNSSAPGRFAAAGSFTASGGNISNLALDYDNAGAIGTNLTGGNGSFSTADGNGRGTASFAATGYALNTIYYMVNSTEALFASSDPLAISPVAAGEALATAGPFSTANLAHSYVGHGIGLSLDGPVAAITAASFDGSVNINGGLLIQDRGGALSSWTVHGAYTVDSATGRAFFTGNFITPVGYLVTGYSGVSAFLLGQDFPATSGVLEAQTASHPADGSYSFGTEEVADRMSNTRVGTVSVQSGNFTGTANMGNSSVPFLVMDKPIPSSAYNFSSGIGTFGPFTDAVTTGSAIYYIDEYNGNAHPSVTDVIK